MKRFWCAVVLLGLVLAMSLTNAWYVHHQASQWMEQLEQAQILSKENQWEQAAQLTQEAFAAYEACDPYFRLLIRHTDVDQIMISFHTVQQYLEQRELDQYTAANMTLILRLKLLSEMEVPSLVNIL